MQIQLTTNAEIVLQQVRGFPAAMAAGVARGMDKENQLTIGHSQKDYLTGPRPAKLGVVTNRLRSSLNASKAVVAENEISSTIGTNVAYAGAHERGFTGAVTVRAHQRKVFASHAAGGVAFLDPRSGRISKSAKKKISLLSGSVTVRSFTRQMKLPARPFLAPALEDRAPAYSATISEAIRLAWYGGRS